jgi:hypothetical protein
VGNDVDCEMMRVVEKEGDDGGEASFHSEVAGRSAAKGTVIKSI